MVTAPAPSQVSCTDAAAANRAGNLTALRRTQPAVAELLPPARTDLTWLCGRDGALTAQDPAGLWVADCSLPRAAAAAMLDSLDAGAGTACFLEPTHAAQLRIALDRLLPNQAILAVVADPHVLDFILACEDFSADLAHGRLWFVTGERWCDQLDALLAEREGLPVPTRFIRLPLTPEALAQSHIAAASAVFTARNEHRARRVAELKATAAGRVRTRERLRICVVAPSLFRLWDDAGWMLRQALLSGPTADQAFVSFDPDRPADASPLAFARVAADADAVVTPNVFRADMPDLVSPSTPWLTWVTLPRIAPYRPDCPADHLLLADESFHAPARAAGWPVERLRLATWPALAQPATPGESLVLISDTRPFAHPPAEFTLSSHQLLWELIADELSRDALGIGADLHGYITARMKRLGIAEDDLDRRLFIEHLIQPAYEQAVARTLIRHRLPLRVHGRGWLEIDAFREHALGPVATRDQFLAAVRDARVLVHPSPVRFAHPIDALSRPVLRTAGLGETDLAAAARALLAPHPAVVLPSLTPLSASLILDITRPP